MAFSPHEYFQKAYTNRAQKRPPHYLPRNRQQHKAGQNADHRVQKMESDMSLLSSPNLLRYALIGDAVASGATGLLMIAGAGFLSGLLGLPHQLLMIAGVILMPFTAMVAYLATRTEPSAGSVWAVILINFAWVAASAFVLFGGVVSPTLLGYAFIAAQAIVVFAFADFQFFGLRNANAA
jgi:hypothetical protein